MDELGQVSLGLNGATKGAWLDLVHGSVEDSLGRKGKKKSRNGSQAVWCHPFSGTLFLSLSLPHSGRKPRRF